MILATEIKMRDLLHCHKENMTLFGLLFKVLSDEYLNLVVSVFKF